MGYLPDALWALEHGLIIACSRLRRYDVASTSLLSTRPRTNTGPIEVTTRVLTIVLRTLAQVWLNLDSIMKYATKAMGITLKRLTFLQSWNPGKGLIWPPSGAAWSDSYGVSGRVDSGDQENELGWYPPFSSFSSAMKKLALAILCSPWLLVHPRPGQTYAGPPWTHPGHGWPPDGVTSSVKIDVIE